MVNFISTRWGLICAYKLCSSFGSLSLDIDYEYSENITLIFKFIEQEQNLLCLLESNLRLTNGHSPTPPPLNNFLLN